MQCSPNNPFSNMHRISCLWCERVHCKYTTHYPPTLCVFSHNAAAHSRVFISHRMYSFLKPTQQKYTQKLTEAQIPRCTLSVGHKNEHEHCIIIVGLLSPFALSHKEIPSLCSTINDKTNGNIINYFIDIYIYFGKRNYTNLIEKENINEHHFEGFCLLYGIIKRAEV